MEGHYAQQTAEVHPAASWPGHWMAAALVRRARGLTQVTPAEVQVGGLQLRASAAMSNAHAKRAGRTWPQPRARARMAHQMLGVSSGTPLGSI
jgi:hypothetical protein